MQEILDLFPNSGFDQTSLQEIDALYPVRITAFIRSRIANGSYSRRAASQYLPSKLELIKTDGFELRPD